MHFFSNWNLVISIDDNLNVTIQITQMVLIRFPQTSRFSIKKRSGWSTCCLIKFMMQFVHKPKCTTKFLLCVSHMKWCVSHSKTFRYPFYVDIYIFRNVRFRITRKMYFWFHAAKHSTKLRTKLKKYKKISRKPF